MPAKPILVRLKPGALFVLLLLLTGCLTEGGFDAEGPLGGGGSRGVPLSQAMQSSASGSREPLHGAGSSDATYFDANLGVAGTAGSGGTAAATSHDDPTFDLQVPMDVGYAVPFNGEFQSITKYTLTPFCIENDRNSFGLFIGGDTMDLKTGSLPASAIDRIWMLEGGVAYRFYFNRAHAFISPYFSANLAYQVLFWHYRNPVFIDGEEIHSDSVDGAGGYAGLGIAFNRNSHLSFFGEAGFGGTVFTDPTAQGFNNDVFSNFGYFMVKAGLCFKF